VTTASTSSRAVSAPQAANRASSRVEWSQRDGAGLLEQGSSSVAEERAHERRLTAREDIRGDAGVVLEVAAQQAVEFVADGQQVLELVEDYQAPLARALVDASREVEHSVQPSQRTGGRTGRERPGHGGQPRYPDLRAAAAPPAHRSPDRSQPTTVQSPLIGALEPKDRVVKARDPGEIDKGRDHAVRVPGDIGERPQERGLAKAPRRRQANRLAAADEPEELVDLAPTVDELVGRKRTVVDERIHGFTASVPTGTLLVNLERQARASRRAAAAARS
jgi:hypothetical protein